MSAQLKAFRCSFLDFIDDPFYASELESVRYIVDGLSDIQIYAALLVALIPGVLALRLSTELYK